MPIYVAPINRVLHEAQTFKPDAIISIVDPTMKNPNFPMKVPILNLNFDDICFEPVSFYDKERYSPPTRSHVEEIFHFGAFFYKKDTNLLTHCYAGISRSSAAAIIALCPHYGYKKAVEMVANIQVYQSEGVSEAGSSWFMPNNLMIKYADDQLALNGELINLVETTFSY